MVAADSRVLARQADARTLAAEHCDAIDRFDKLRLVADDGMTIVAVFDLSFSIPGGDHERFAAYGLNLDERTDARCGPCVRDDEQGSGLAPRLLAETARIASGEGRSRLILWGGVHHEIYRARQFYRREGFSEVGRTLDHRHGAPDLIERVAYPTTTPSVRARRCPTSPADGHDCC